MIAPARTRFAPGDVLEPLEIPLSRTFIVATAIASRDYQDVHHDPQLAQERGSQDIFMNILTSNGLVERYVRGIVGPEPVITRIRIRLGAPNYPGDTMTFTGTVSAVNGREVEMEIVGKNAIGVHASGTVVLRMAEGQA